MVEEVVLFELVEWEVEEVGEEGGLGEGLVQPRVMCRQQGGQQLTNRNPNSIN